MTERPSLIVIGTARRRRWRIAAIVGVVLLFAATAAVAIAIWPDRTHHDANASATAGVTPSTRTTASARGPGAAAPPGESTDAPIGLGGAINLRFALRPVSGPPPVRYVFKHPPVAGVLFDVKSGEVLWERHPRLEHPIASLTKMMTALLVAGHDSAADRVKISAKAARTPGSATGLLPRGRKVPLE